MQGPIDTSMDSKRFQELVEESTFNHGSFADLFTCGVCDMKMWADNIHEHLQSHISVCTNYQFNNETKTILPVFDHGTIGEPVAQKRKLPMPGGVLKQKVLVKSPRRQTYYATTAYGDTQTVDEREQRTDLDVENYLNSGTSLTDRLSVLLDQQGGNVNEPTYFAAKPYPTNIIGPMHSESESETKTPGAKKKGKTVKTAKSKSKPKTKKTVSRDSVDKESVPWKSVAPITPSTAAVEKSAPLQIGETITHIDLPYVVEGKQLGTYHCAVIIESYTPKDSEKKAKKSIEQVYYSSDSEAIDDVNDVEDSEFTATPLRTNELQSAVNTITNILGSPAKSVAILDRSPAAVKGKKKRDKNKKKKKCLTSFRSLNSLRVSCASCVWTDEHINGLITSELKKTMFHLRARVPALDLYFESIVEIAEFDIYSWAFRDFEMDILKKDVGTDVPELKRLASEKTRFGTLKKESITSMISRFSNVKKESGDINHSQNTNVSTPTSKQKVTSKSATKAKTTPTKQSPGQHQPVLGAVNMSGLGTLGLNPQTNMLNLSMNLLAPTMFQNPIQNYTSPYLYFVNQPNTNENAANQRDQSQATSTKTLHKAVGTETGVSLSSSTEGSKKAAVDKADPMGTDNAVKRVNTQSSSTEAGDKRDPCPNDVASTNDKVSQTNTKERLKLKLKVKEKGEEKSDANSAGEVDKNPTLHHRKEVIYDAKTKKKYTITYLSKPSNNEEQPKLIEKEDGTVEVDETIKSFTKTTESPAKKSKYIVYVRKKPADTKVSQAKSNIVAVEKVSDSFDSAKAKVNVQSKANDSVQTKANGNVQTKTKVTEAVEKSVTTTTAVSSSPVLTINSPLASLQQPVLQMPTGYMPFQHNFVPVNSQGLFVYNNTLFQHTPFPVVPQPNMLTANTPQFVIPQAPATTLATTGIASTPKSGEKKQDKGNDENNEKSDSKEQNADEVDGANNMDDQEAGESDGVQNTKKTDTVANSVNQEGSSTGQAVTSNTAIGQVIPGKAIEVVNTQQKSGSSGILIDSRAEKANTAEFERMNQNTKPDGNIYWRFGEWKYRCEICKVDMETKDAIDAHNAAVHTHKEILENYLELCSLYVCIGCGLSRPDKRLFQAHVAKCDSAVKYGFDKFDLAQYKNYVHLKAKIQKYTCEYCSSVTVNLKSFKKHSIECPKKPKLKCDMCTFETLRDRDMGLHKLKVHRVKAVKCEKCDRLFSTVQALQIHERFKHEEGKQVKTVSTEPIVCDKCGKILMGKQRYEIHVKSKHSEPPSCIFCDMRFLFLSQCQIHEGNHTGDFRFSCVTCKTVFPSCISYLDHMTYKHNIEKQHSTKLNKTLRRIRGLIFTNICSLCKESFQDENMFLTHMKVKHKMETDQARKARLDALRMEKLAVYQQKVETGELKESWAGVNMNVIENQEIQTMPNVTEIEKTLKKQPEKTPEEEKSTRMADNQQKGTQMADKQETSIQMADEQEKSNEMADKQETSTQMADKQ